MISPEALELLKSFAKVCVTFRAGFTPEYSVGAEEIHRSSEIATNAVILDKVTAEDCKQHGILHQVIDDAFRNKVLWASRQLVLPAPTTAHNLEVLTMNGAWWHVYVHSLGPAPEVFAGDVLLESDMTTTFERLELLRRILRSIDVDIDGKCFSPGLEFAEAWHSAAFARVEVSHKLAAALALTSAPDKSQVPCPWPAVSITVPEGMFEPVRRAWVVPIENGGHHVISTVASDGAFPRGTTSTLTVEQNALLANYVAGVLLTVSDRDRPVARHGGNASKGSRRRSSPVVGQLYRVGAPVQIDLRETVREAWSGKRSGGTPKVQFLVRGHWRNQACGPGHAERRRTWIEPFWKGPAESRILLRGHALQKEEHDG